MDDITYSWLLNNKDESPKLIDCILILSCNDLFISFNNLMNYYNDNKNNKLQQQQQSILNEQQFKILDNNIQSLNNISIIKYNSSNNNSCTICGSCNVVVKNDNKFNLSLNLIIENNNNINKQTTITTTTTTELFFKVWRNIIIKNEILCQIRLFNIHYNEIMYFTYEDIWEYKYNGYLSNIYIGYNDNKSNDRGLIKSNSIPNGIKSIEFEDYNFNLIQENSIPETVTKLNFNGNFNYVITKSTFSNNITSLQFNQNFNQSLDGEWLPKSLTSLKFGYNCNFNQPIKIGQLPNTLTELILPLSYSGVIEIGSIPNKIKDLNFIHDSNNLKSSKIKMSTTNLKFGNDSLKDNIEFGDIPHNVTSIKFGKYSLIMCRILPNSLPTSLTKLHLSDYFDQELDSFTLPSNLTKINFGNSFNKPLSNHHHHHGGIFPKSIKSITFGNSFRQVIPNGYFYGYSNLVSLDLGSFNANEIPINMLPQSLTRLIIPDFEGTIQSSLCALHSLKILTLGGINRILKYGELPQSITSLSIITKYPIGPNLLPCNLEELYIRNNEFKHDISEDGYLPNSLKSIYISNDFYNLINTLNVSFFYKFIKFE